MKERTKKRGYLIKTAGLLSVCSLAVLGLSVNGLAEFPEHYQAMKENVTFDCQVICPESVNESAYPEYKAELLWGDKERQEKMFLEGREIREKHESEASEYGPATTYYLLKDGASLGAGGFFSYSAPTSDFYGQMGLISSYEGTYDQNELEMGSPEEYIQKAEKLLAETGFSAEDYRFQWMSFDRDVLSNLEQQLMAESRIDPGDEKGEWTQEDEAYILYAWQYKKDVPILTELMGLDSPSCLDRVENAAVIAVYSSRGLELILTSKYYDLQETGKEHPLLEFEKAAETVEKKLNSILGKNQYQVVEAKFFERVKQNEEQELEAEPVWRFLISENEEAYFTVLVNAITGEESYFS